MLLPTSKERDGYIVLDERRALEDMTAERDALAAKLERAK